MFAEGVIVFASMRFAFILCSERPTSMENSELGCHVERFVIGRWMTGSMVLM